MRQQQQVRYDRWDALSCLWVFLDDAYLSNTFPTLFTTFKSTYPPRIRHFLTPMAILQPFLCWCSEGITCKWWKSIKRKQVWESLCGGYTHTPAPDVNKHNTSDKYYSYIISHFSVVFHQICIILYSFTSNFSYILLFFLHSCALILKQLCFVPLLSFVFHDNFWCLFSLYEN